MESSKESQVKHTKGTDSGRPQHSQAKQRTMALILLVLVSTVFGFVGGYFGDQAGEDNRAQQVRQEIVAEEGEVTARIVEEVGDSVVSINVTTRGVRDTFFGPQAVQQRSAGTGIIIDADGTILTNRHVIPASATTVGITLKDGTEFENVEVLGRTDPNDPLDVAFLKIKDLQGKKLKAAKLGDSSEMQVGEKVIAIGNALGLFQNTVTTGVLSGYGRSVIASDAQSSEGLQNLFQTDAAINEGNSGGPLMNINGEVIGLNTAVAGGGAENIGFAIPINDIKGLISSIIEKGKLERPFLGVRYLPLTDAISSELNLDVTRGAYIVESTDGQPSIVPDSPAAEAGLREGDVITEVAGEKIDERNSLLSLLSKHSVGEQIELTIVRGGEEQKVDVRLKAAP